jgi:truncated hemoglobin YjbI
MRMTQVVVAFVLALILVGNSGCQTMRRLRSAITGTPTTQKAAAAAAGEKSEPKKAGDPADEDDEAKSKEPQKTLYERLGGEKAIAALVDDLVARAAANPKVNFTRKGSNREWPATGENVARLKARLIQFFGTATGGPQRYEGQDMRTAHRGMQITGAEFDAFVADAAASLDHLEAPQKERKEVLELIEAARGTIVEQPPR